MLSDIRGQIIKPIPNNMDKMIKKTLNLCDLDFSKESVLSSNDVPQKGNPPYNVLEIVNPNTNYKEVTKLLLEYIGQSTVPTRNEKKTRKEIDTMFGERVQSNEHQSKYERQFVEDVLFQFDHILSKYSSDFGETEILEFEVNTLNNGPVPVNVRPTGCTLVPVKKKDGTWRFATDYGQLNQITKLTTTYCHSMELLTDLQLGEARYFIPIDMAGVYFAVPINAMTTINQNKLSSNNEQHSNNEDKDKENDAPSNQRIYTLFANAKTIIEPVKSLAYFEPNGQIATSLTIIGIKLQIPIQDVIEEVEKLIKGATNPTVKNITVWIQRKTHIESTTIANETNNTSTI
ncbi:unnamed protein product [Lepeophtheirus salmonis]|uniref:(salmon louse) hypothetical protein n=1 Tax=Lepeophtheirus salmonis TaxID=72036 RepID=A0A7R8CHL2_LEPSM|nr:unnamed protein product [Lepeophtheirus salmonis]CAF2820923.1 unnamed protein product [Lepeophtheirus salmonis]